LLRRWYVDVLPVSGIDPLLGLLVPLVAPVAQPVVAERRLRVAGPAGHDGAHRVLANLFHKRAQSQPSRRRRRDIGRGDPPPRLPQMPEPIGPGRFAPGPDPRPLLVLPHRMPDAHDGQILWGVVVPTIGQPA